MSISHIGESWSERPAGWAGNIQFPVMRVVLYYNTSQERTRYYLFRGRLARFSPFYLLPT